MQPQFPSITSASSDRGDNVGVLIVYAMLHALTARTVRFARSVTTEVARQIAIRLDATWVIAIAVWWAFVKACRTNWLTLLCSNVLRAFVIVCSSIALQRWPSHIWYVATRVNN